MSKIAVIGTPLIAIGTDKLLAELKLNALQATPAELAILTPISPESTNSATLTEASEACPWWVTELFNVSSACRTPLPPGPIFPAIFPQILLVSTDSPCLVKSTEAWTKWLSKISNMSSTCWTPSTTGPRPSMSSNNDNPAVALAPQISSLPEMESTEAWTKWLSKISNMSSTCWTPSTSGPKQSMSSNNDNPAVALALQISSLLETPVTRSLSSGSAARPPTTGPRILTEHPRKLLASGLGTTVH